MNSAYCSDRPFSTAIASRISRTASRYFPRCSTPCGARRSINFETYIYWSGDIGREFADALIERSQAKVPVHVLVDWVGSQKMDPVLVDRMAEGG